MFPSTSKQWNGPLLGPSPTDGGKIPIRKLCVFNVDPYYDDFTLHKIFGSYGDLYRINVPKKQHKPSKYIFVTYLTTEAAKRVLLHKKELHNAYGFHVTSADQWHQPLELPGGKIEWFRGYRGNYEQKYEKSKKKSNQDEEPEGPITKLNSDCLSHIFSFLSKRQLIGVERVCKRWRAVSLSCWAKEKSLDFKKHFILEPNFRLRVDHLRQLFLRCGHCLTSLDVSDKALEFDEPQHVRVLDMIGKFCTNLEQLNISRISVNKRGFSPNFLNATQNLQLLNMDRCSGLKDHILAPLLKGSKKLAKLVVSSSDIEGTSLFKLSKTCKHLDVNMCFSLTPNTLKLVLRGLPNLNVLKANGIKLDPRDLQQNCGMFKELQLSKSGFYIQRDDIVSSFSNLKILNLGFNDMVDDKMVILIVEYCPNVEKLDISGCASPTNPRGPQGTSVTDCGIKKLVHLRKLKWLTMNSRSNITSEALEHLAVAFKSQLLSIECRACPGITNSGPSKLVALCTSLANLDLSFCNKITSEFLKFALDSIQLRTNNIPLQLKVSGIPDDELPEKHPLLNIEVIPFNDFFEFGFLPWLDTDDNSDIDGALDEFAWEAVSLFGDDIELYEYIYQVREYCFLDDDDTEDDDDDEYFDGFDDDDDDDDYFYDVNQDERLFIG